MWRSNFYSESQNHVLAMHIIALLSNFWKISRSSDNENCKESDVDMEVEVDEVDEKR